MEQEHEEYIRQQFAKAFGWFKRKQYDYEREDIPLTPTWEQIFLHLGELLNAQKRLDYITDVENLKMQMQELLLANHEREMKEREKRLATPHQ